MSVKTFEAIKDEQFIEWVEAYFGYSADELPFGDLVIKACASAWITAKKGKEAPSNG